MDRNKVKLDTLRTRLAQYYEAESKILEGQSYSLGSRSLTRTNLGEVQNMIRELEAKINSLETRGTTKRKVARIIPMDL
ncbi:DUF6148 family protein [Anaerocolumna chitinilytica]|uniref:Uncharacterized protein n=1 Tax=Anaerocolumna chitinilytica TaxID=1727145 RepID=A0A7I8DLD1_9FIRM|nr:DUF6148 family protein [Anaerocolumna chitinilytica]BCJ98101.1 hypothetical protein bsdcttw_11420 [Anaerocolumna chitinilytica]